jgi:hypothetical protein
MIKLIKFDGHWLISQVEEIPDAEFGDPDCVLKYPYEIEGTCMGPFPEHSSEKELVVRSANISVITEPNTFILAQYTTLINEEQEPDDEFIEIDE